MKKSQAFAQIGAMSEVVKLSDIIMIILQIDNFKFDTLKKLKPASPYTGEDLIPLSDIYVDLTYQRKLKIQRLINRLIDSGGFDKAVAGHVDLAVRPDGRKFVWDGFHRSIMAAIVGLLGIKTSIFTHDITHSEAKCQRIEAKMFKTRNADQTSMAPDEIFRAKVVFRDSTAMDQLALLKRCKLNVGNTNLDTDAYDLGGFGMFDKNWESVDSRFMVEASEVIRKAYPNVKTMSVNLLLGMAALLSANENEVTVNTASITEIKNTFAEMTNGGNTPQADFIKPLIAGKKIESVARNLLRRGLQKLYNDGGDEVHSLIRAIGITDDDEESLEES